MLPSAEALEETLIGNGYEVRGIARSVKRLVALCELHQPDYAVLDVQRAQADVTPFCYLRDHQLFELGHPAE